MYNYQVIYSALMLCNSAELKRKWSGHIIITIVAYLFYNLYIFDPYGLPLLLRHPQCVQIVQSQTHETWTRLKKGIFSNHTNFSNIFRQFGFLGQIMESCNEVKFISVLFRTEFVWIWPFVQSVLVTDRLSSRIGWTSLLNPSFPCQM